MLAELRGARGRFEAKARTDICTRTRWRVIRIRIHEPRSIIFILAHIQSSLEFIYFANSGHLMHLQSQFGFLSHNLSSSYSVIVLRLLV